jgi:DNA-binding NtrC family response regulator
VSVRVGAPKSGDERLRWIRSAPGEPRCPDLSALSPSIIESELFGHCRGAFTGAVDHRVGWLEQVALGGTLFLDEIGDVETTLQVKLLRVLERREFQRLGETETHTFSGRLVAATHRDLAALIERGAFREDLYFRLCGHLITTPSLRAQLDDAPEELPRMVRLLAARIVTPPFVEPLAERALRWIQTELPSDYAWPGNVRELAQCLRNVLMSNAYRPLGKQAVKRTDEEFYRKFEEGRLTADEILRRYVTLVHAQTGSYRETAKRTGLTRRTLAEKIDHALLATLIKEGAGKKTGG